MRTTLNLDEEALAVLKDYAESRSVPLGKAASELVLRGWRTPVQTQLVNGFYAVVLPADSPSISSERVKELLEDEG
jgi:hypothetical protein